MKKFLIVCCVLILSLVALGAALWFALPSIGTYAGSRLLGKAINGSVQIGHLESGYHDGIIFIEIHDVVMKGTVEGTVKNASLQLNPWKVVYIKAINISDFDIVIKDGGGRLNLIPVPVELAEFRQGTLVYRGQKYVVRELKVRNFNTGGHMEFELDAGAEGLGNIKTKGGGFFDDKRSDLSGGLTFSRIDLSRVLEGYEGLLSGDGTFGYKNGVFAFITDVDASGFVMREKFLKKPIQLNHSTAKARVEIIGNRIDLKFRNVLFNGVPVLLDIRISRMLFASMKLETGPLAVPDVKEYIDLAPLAKRGADVLDLLKEGTITVKRLTYTDPRPFLAQFYLAGVSGIYKKIEVRDVAGIVDLDEKKMLLTQATGTFKRSAFNDVSVVVPFASEKYIEAKGKFALDMRDVSELEGLEDFSIRTGLAEGEGGARGREDTDIDFWGSGRIKDTRFVWRNLDLEASGPFEFYNGDVKFEPLHVSGEKTELVLMGPAQKESFHLHLKGTIGAGHIGSLLHLPYPIDGVVLVDGALVKERDSYSAQGNLSLKDFFLEVPGLLRKEKGVDSAATVGLSWGEGTAHVERLTCTLADATFRASGDVTRDRILNLKMAVSAPALGTVSKLFLADRIRAGGSLQLSVSAAELRFPLEELPLIDGELRLSGGNFRLPFLVKPFSDVDLAADFKGGRSFVDVTGLRIGNTVLRKATLSLEALKSQRFSVNIDMKNFEPGDFATVEKNKIKIPVISKESLMAKLAGEFDIKSDRVAGEDLVATDVELFGVLIERRMGFSKVSGRILGGNISLQGAADLSKDVPTLRVSCKAQGIKGGLFLRLFDPDSQVLEATGAMTAHLSSSGNDGDTLLKNMGGEATISSRNGIIRKWNLLSKILGILNVYDLFQGKVNLLQKGLPYSRAGLALRGENGTFKTDNFRIDSPSMVIAGQGTITMAGLKVNGKLIVSPLVALDRTVDTIPILRSIFKWKEGGFGYVALDVNGSLRDPELSTRYADTLGRRPFSILKNILFLPKGVFER